MNKLLLLFAIMIFSKTTWGQNYDSTTQLATRLASEIRSFGVAQGKYIGCYGNLSEVYQKMDSLKNTIGSEAFINYINDTSVNLQYYAYIEILITDENLAFDKLISLSQNTESIQFQFAGQFHDNVTLIELLAFEYLEFIKFKYYDGGNGLYHDKIFSFDEKNRRIYRNKEKMTYDLLAANEMHYEWIENYHKQQPYNKKMGFMCYRKY